MNCNDYFGVVNKHYGRRVEQRLRHQMGFIYQDVSFHGKRVLDIGGGTGLHSFYAVARGAEYVLSLEPEAQGSTGGVLEGYMSLRNDLGYTRAECRESTVQTFEAPVGTFDVILIQDAINHLDEEACIKLHESETSRLAYLAVFQKLARMAATGACLVFSDCSSRNAFAALGLVNPFDPNIEWHKHQRPELWIGLLEESGFANATLRWSSPARLGKLGQFIFGSALGAYFFTSHFVVIMTKTEPQ